MKTLRERLIERLSEVQGIEARPSPVAGGTALFYRNIEFAHFHNANELDLKLTKSVIKEMGLKHPTDSVCHPKRSQNSAFIELRFKTEDELSGVIKLVKIAASKISNEFKCG